MNVHPILEAASRGELPPWARVVRKGRVAHMRRVADLLDEWAKAAELSKVDRTRWRAAGWLHDSLKEADPEELRGLVEGSARQLPEAVMHGPAAAEMLRREGVEDEELLLAVAYHTLGHPDLAGVGRALYAADFLDPGRRMRRKWRAKLRSHMPEGMDRVVRKILKARMIYLVRSGRPIRPETHQFWNRMTDG